MYSPVTQSVAVVNRGRQTIEPNAINNTITINSSNNFVITWTQDHPDNNAHVAQYCLYSSVGFIHSGYLDSKLFVMITKNTGGADTPLSFNLTIF